MKIVILPVILAFFLLSVLLTNNDTNAQQHEDCYIETSHYDTAVIHGVFSSDSLEQHILDTPVILTGTITINSCNNEVLQITSNGVIIYKTNVPFEVTLSKQLLESTEVFSK